MNKQRLKTIEILEFKNFKEKISITKDIKNVKVEIIDNRFVYVEKYRYQ